MRMRSIIVLCLLAAGCQTPRAGAPLAGKLGGNDADTWELVHFIRHINELTDEHLAEMTTFNPKTRAELEEERADEAFLAGEQVETPSGHVH